jgi:hypothetical protein
MLRVTHMPSVQLLSAYQALEDPGRSSTASQPATWVADLQWVVGAHDGPAEEIFGLITNVSIGPNGSIYAIDFQSQDVRVFSRRGTHLRTIGGLGNGPAEFQGAIAMAWNVDDELWVADAFNHRYAIFDTTGTLKATKRRPFASVARWQQRMQLPGGDRIIDEIAWTVGGRLRRGFVLLDTSGTVVDTFPPLPLSRNRFQAASPSDLSRMREAVDSLRPFIPRLLYQLAGDGSLWYAHSDSFVVVHRDLDGGVIKTIRSDRPRALLRRAEADRIRIAARTAGMDANSLNLGRQVVQSLVILDDGNLLVQIEEQVGEDSSLYDVFDDDGVRIAELRMPFPVDPQVNIGVRGDTLVAVTRDALDVQRLFRAVIRRD